MLIVIHPILPAPSAIFAAVKKAGLLPYIALVGVALIYASNYLVAKGLLPDVIAPAGFIVLRVYGASLLFFLLMAVNRERPKRKDLPRIALCGVFGIAVNQLMFFEGLALTSAINSSIIITTTPIIVLPLSALLLKERITLRKALGILIGAAGAIALVILSSKSGSPQVSMKGDLFILINASSYALYIILVKPLMNTYNPLTVISWVFFFGALYVTPFGLEKAMAVDYAALTPEQWFSLLFVILMATFSVYLLNAYAISKVSPNVVSSFIYLQPVFTLGFAFLFWKLGLFDALKPFFNWGTALCTATIFVGVWMVSGGKKKVVE